MAVGPKARVEPPALAPGRRGLIAAAIEVIEPDERWVNGFAYEAETCDPAQAIPIYCEPLPDGDGYSKEPGASGGIIEYDPFSVVGADKCTTLDRARDRVGRARRQLIATEGYQIEREFWDGAIATAEGYPNPFLADASTTDLGSDDQVGALGKLEQALGECLHGQRGMIHATLTTVTYWNQANLLRFDGNLILTALDTIVVTGPGYSGSAPGSPPTPPASVAAAAYAYGTGLVYLRRGPMFPVDDGNEASTVDRQLNDQTVFVERAVAAVAAGCCTIGIEVVHANA